MIRSLSICLMILATIPSQAQNDKEAYEAFRHKAQSSYQDFRAKCNERYAAFLEQAWKSFQSKEPLHKPKEENHIPPVVYNDNEEDKKDGESDNKEKEIVLHEIIDMPPLPPQPKPVSPVEEDKGNKERELFSFIFYGTNMNVSMGDVNRLSMSGCTEEDVAEAWRKCSESNFTGMLHDCLSIRSEYNLGDWAYLCLLRRMCAAFYGERSNEATLVSAFLFSQSGYKMRLARSDDGKLYMLIGSRHIIYEMPYYEFDGYYYLPLDCGESSLHICQAAFPGEKSLSFWMDKAMTLKEDDSDMRMLKSANYPEMEVGVRVNRNIINFFNDYPSTQMEDDFMTRWAIYGSVPLSASVANEMYPKLDGILKDKAAPEAVGMLLDFVQTAFVYEYDDKVWGCDRPFFAEETLYYPYCDCEDRSILFSHMVRDLLGLKVALVYYPGHLAAAVKFNEEVNGDYVIIGNERYTVCDPTYIGAPIGRTMPGMDNLEAKAIVLN